MLFYSDHIYLNHDVFRQFAHFITYSGWRCVREKTGIYVIHGTEIAHVIQQDSAFYYVFKRIAGLVEYGPYIVEAPFGLFAYGRWNTSCDRIDRNLARYVKSSVGLDGLGIGPDSFGCM